MYRYMTIRSDVLMNNNLPKIMSRFLVNGLLPISPPPSAADNALVSQESGDHTPYISEFFGTTTDGFGPSNHVSEGSYQCRFPRLVNTNIIYSNIDGFEPPGCDTRMREDIPPHTTLNHHFDSSRMTSKLVVQTKTPEKFKKDKQYIDIILHNCTVKQLCVDWPFVSSHLDSSKLTKMSSFTISCFLVDRCHFKMEPVLKYDDSQFGITYEPPNVKTDVGGVFAQTFFPLTLDEETSVWRSIKQTDASYRWIEYVEVLILINSFAVHITVTISARGAPNFILGDRTAPGGFDQKHLKTLLSWLFNRVNSLATDGRIGDGRPPNLPYDSQQKKHDSSINEAQRIYTDNKMHDNKTTVDAVIGTFSDKIHTNVRNHLIFDMQPYEKSRPSGKTPQKSDSHSKASVVVGNGFTLFPLL